MKSSFDRDYFEAGVETGVSLYSNYRWIPELTIPFASHLCEVIGLRWGQSVLDFGCAKGYLVHALRLLHREAWGYDISAYAISHAPKEVYPYVTSGIEGIPNRYDHIIAKDVLEHIGSPEILPTLRMLREMSKNLFVIVPLGDGENYVIPAMHRDLTHEIAQPLSWWADILGEAGFSVFTASYRIDGMKEHWASYEKGHAFITCT